MAMILTAFVPQAIRILDGFIMEEEILLLGVTSEIKRLKRRLEVLRNILHDAESKSRNERDIQPWLNKLKEVMYDIDDMTDHYKVEMERSKRLLAKKSCSLRVRMGVKCYLPLMSCFPSVAFRHEIAIRIKRLNSRVDRVTKELSKFQLISTHADQVSQTSTCTFRLTDFDVVGTQIEEDAKNIIKLLTEDQMNFYAIAGAGGIGKTTLAQKIYNDERIKAHFQVRMWVSGTQQLTDANILKEIICGAGGSYDEAQTVEQLEPVVRTTLEHKKFLIVADDVWSKQVCDNLLQRILQGQVAGSSILITTRNEALARELSGTHLLRMELLSTEDGWSLLSKKVFQEGHDQDIQELVNVGVNIVRRCKGLPLAICIIAGVLRNKRRSSEEWDKLFLDPAWFTPDLPNDITRALYLAYQDLPSNLKQCFVYCSLFPEDHLFRRQPLIQYWVAEGLVEVKESSTAEETAEGYYNELIWRNLLQPDSNQSGSCKMHGLLRFLAHFVAGEENLFGNLILMAQASTKPRRISIAAKGLTEIPSEMQKQDSLRTLLLFKNPLVGSFPDNLIQGLKHLRVLDIHDTEIESLPCCIGDLLHLRHLNVSGTRLRELPDSLERLISLQFLSVRMCKLMVALPKWLAELQSLRSLDLVGTQINRMPFGIRKMENLNCLLGFVVGYDNDNVFTSTLEDLGPLTRLRYLLLQNLERVSNGAVAARARLRSKKHLKNLVLNWSSNVIDVEHCELDRIKEVLEELYPSSSLEELEIRGYPGLELPNWISSVSSPLTKLAKLCLHQCSSIQQLPQLGHLPQLSLLYIAGATGVTTIGTELFGMDTCPQFPKLDTLIIEDMPNWEDWEWQFENSKTLPCLRDLQLVKCPMLKSLPEGLQHVTALRVLVIHGACQLIEIKDLSSVKKLSIDESTNLVEISNLSSLENLKVSNCPALKKLENLSHLQQLHIIDESINCLPEGLGSDTTKELQWLEMDCNEALLRRFFEGGSDWPKLQYIPDAHIHCMSGCTYLSNGNYSSSCEDNLQAIEEVDAEMAIVPVAANISSINSTAITIPNATIGTINENFFGFSSHKALLILCILIFLSALFDHFVVSPAEYLGLGSGLISYVIDYILIFITIPLCIARNTFGFLSYSMNATYKLLDKLLHGAYYMSVTVDALLQCFVELFLSSPFRFTLTLLSLMAALVSSLY